MAAKDKHHALALEMYRAKKYDDALRVCRKILRSKPTDYQTLSLLTHAALEKGALLEAAEAAERLTRLRPNYVLGWILLGRIRLFKGDAEAARDALETGVDCNPRHPSAWFHLGLAIKILGQADEAREAFKKAFELAPGETAMRYNYVLALIDADRAEEAERISREALNDGVGAPEIEHALGMSLLARNKLQEALLLLRSSVMRHPRYAPLRTDYGGALAAGREPYLALDQLRIANELEPNKLLNHQHLFRTYQNLGLIKEALVELDILNKHMDLRENWTLLRASLLSMLGQHSEAIGLIEPFLDDPKLRLASHNVLGKCARKTNRVDDAVGRIRKLLSEIHFNDSDESTRDQLARLEFTFGSLLDQQGKYEEAFSAYAQGNEHRGVFFDYEMRSSNFYRRIEFYSHERFEQLPISEITSDIPIFIVGMPRSGTSLLEQMLSSHPLIFGGGELSSIANMIRQLNLEFESRYPDWVEIFSRGQVNEFSKRHVDELHRFAGGKPYVTDKMPHNFANLGFIAQLFPKARIIHCRRTPQATALSIFFQDFAFAGGHPYAYNLADIGGEYFLYNMLMQHWAEVLPLPIHTVDYETLVEDPESSTKELCAFLGIEWEPAMLRFHESKRVVITASNQQVQEKLYNSSVSHWKHYADHMQPFEDALANQGRKAS